MQTLSVVCVLAVCVVSAVSLQNSERQAPGSQKQSTDAVEAAQKPGAVANTRPEQQKTDHDRSAIFTLADAQPASPVFANQPKAGRLIGFDFYRDPLGSDRPFMAFDEIMNKESANKAAVMKAQMVLLESRYILTPRLDPQMKMTRGKPLVVGPTAKLASGATWDQLG